MEQTSLHPSDMGSDILRALVAHDSLPVNEEGTGITLSIPSQQIPLLLNTVQHVCSVAAQQL